MGRVAFLEPEISMIPDSGPFPRIFNASIKWDYLREGLIVNTNSSPIGAERLYRLKNWAPGGNIPPILVPSFQVLAFDPPGTGSICGEYD